MALAWLLILILIGNEGTSMRNAIDVLIFALSLLMAPTLYALFDPFSVEWWAYCFMLGVQAILIAVVVRGYFVARRLKGN